MNQVLLIARYQFLMARRTVRSGYYFSIAVIFLLFGLISYMLPFSYLFISFPLVALFMQNTISRILLNIPYELDPGYLSIYPISQQKKFNLLLIVDFFHISGLAYLLSFLILSVFSIIRFSFIQGAFLIAIFTVYWFFFSTLFLCLRILCRRNYAYFYIIRVSGSVIVFGYLFASRVVRNMDEVKHVVNSVSPILFLLYSILAVLALTFVLNRWLAFYLQRHPFADPLLSDKFVNPRWK